MRTKHGLVNTPMESSQMTSVVYRTALRSVLKETMEIYSDRLQGFVGQCPQSWRFLQRIKCFRDDPPSTIELIELSGIIPPVDEWRILGALLMFSPESNESRIHTWRWYRLKSLFKEYSYYSERQSACLAALSVVDMTQPWTKRRRRFKEST